MRTRQQIVAELRKHRTELRQADGDQATQARALANINQLLDERLEQRGAHAADCSCWECETVVADVLLRRHTGHAA